MSGLSTEVRRYVKAPNLGHLATIRPDGAPHSVPIWIGQLNEQLFFLTSPRSRKARNIARDKRVCISIVQHDRPNAMALIHGRVTDTIHGDEAWRMIDELSKQYLGRPYPLREDRAVYVITVDRATSHDYS